MLVTWTQLRRMTHIDISLSNKYILSPLELMEKKKEKEKKKKKEEKKKKKEEEEIHKRRWDEKGGRNIQIFATTGGFVREICKLKKLEHLPNKCIRNVECRYWRNNGFQLQNRSEWERFATTEEKKSKSAELYHDDIKTWNSPQQE